MAEDGRRALTVGEMMHTRVILTTPDSPMSEAAAEMVRERVGSALVMQGPFLAGILTERDVLRAAASCPVQAILVDQLDESEVKKP